jgi:transposase
MKRLPQCKTILLDVHSRKSQMTVADETGDVLLELQVPTTKKGLRRAVDEIVGPKRVIMENGPMAALVKDALKDLVEEIISADPTQNALIARSEHSTDELDAQRLGTIYRARGIHQVEVPEEPHRTLRSLLSHDLGLVGNMTSVRNRLKGLLRRHAIPTAGCSVYRAEGRKEILAQLPNAHLKWQLQSQYRLLDQLRAERVATHRQASRLARKIPHVRLLRAIPGVGSLTAMTIVAWIINPRRFKSMAAISAYAGIGLGQGVTAWAVVSPTRASKRGNRALKRVLFLAARAAIGGINGLSERYQARIELGWDDRAAVRDIARKILFIACAMMRTGRHYDDTMIDKPTAPRTPPRRRKLRTRKVS